MRAAGVLLVCWMLVATGSASANDWEKFYQPVTGMSIPIVPSNSPPTVLSLPGDWDATVLDMWRKGYAVIGVFTFNSSNSKTSDAIKLAVKLKASHVVIGTELSSSQTTSIPITSPTAQTSYTNGNVAVSGSAGFASGNYSSTTTTYGSQTLYVPITVNRFNKAAIYFGPLAKRGVGILFRGPNGNEVTKFETRHLLVVRAVREGSPADSANILDGDTIISINGSPAGIDSLQVAVAKGSSISFQLDRNGARRDIEVTMSPDYRD